MHSLSRLFWCLVLSAGGIFLPRLSVAQGTPMTTATPVFQADPDADTSWKIAARKTPTHLSVTTIDGKTLDLASLHGKVVVLEFWSLEGCNTCSQQETTLKAAYTKYHSKGLEIIRVVLGDSSIDRSMLEQEAKDNGVTWPETFTPSPVASSEIMDRYHIRYLPAPLVVFDKQGKFVTNKMKPGELERYLKDVLK